MFCCLGRGGGFNTSFCFSKLILFIHKREEQSKQIMPWAYFGKIYSLSNYLPQFGRVFTSILHNLVYRVFTLLNYLAQFGRVFTLLNYLAQFGRVFTSLNYLAQFDRVFTLLNYLAQFGRVFTLLNYLAQFGRVFYFIKLSCTVW